MKVKDTVFSPGHLSFSHPQEIHVASQDREVRIRNCCQASPRVSIAKKDIHNQLQACLPADWLPKEEDPYKSKAQGRGSRALGLPFVVGR